MEIPNEVVECMISKFKEGYSCAQIAREYGYDRKKVSNTLKKQGLQIQRGYTEEIIDQAKTLYEQGRSLTKIAKLLGIDRNQLSLKFQQLGIRQQALPSDVKQAFTETEETNNIVNWYQQGMSIKQISLAVGRSTSYVYRVLQHYDVVVTDRVFKRYRLTWEPFHDIETQEQAYWLGFIMADGNVQISDRYSLEFGQSIKDKERVESFANFVNTQSALPIEEKFVRTNFASAGCLYVRVMIHDKQMVEDLISYGCVPRKSLVKKFPWRLSQSLWRHFIRGYFDGNGTVSYTQSSKQLSFGFTSSYEMCTAIENILLSEDVVHKRVQLSCEGKAFGFRHSGNKQAQSFFHYLYCQATTYMQRKYDIFNAVLSELYG